MLAFGAYCISVNIAMIKKLGFSVFTWEAMSWESGQRDGETFAVFLMSFLGGFSGIISGIWYGYLTFKREDE
jgi:hypothetical protein